GAASTGGTGSGGAASTNGGAGEIVITPVLTSGTEGAGTGCANPAGTAGTVMYNHDNHVMQYCNSGVWVAMGPLGNAGAGTCSGPSANEGAMFYNSTLNTMEYCNGTSWVAIGPL
ncbi:MAG: hypothetical protein KGQ70_06000, partial [Alphaproteobacteria bacterium]|nr:hypothetical protein [Alphaproteobacteria bacterium]